MYASLFTFCSWSSVRQGEQSKRRKNLTESSGMAIHTSTSNVAQFRARRCLPSLQQSYFCDNNRHKSCKLTGWNGKFDCFRS